MTRLPLFFLFILTCQLTACGPGSKPGTTQNPARQSPADSPATGPQAGANTARPGSGDRLAAGSGEAAYRISRSQVGPIRIGMPVAALRQTFPPDKLREVEIHLEGTGFKAYEVGSHEAGLRVEEKCEPECRVWRIQVKDPAYRTAEGLGVGSTLGEVKEHYPISFLGSGETEIVAVSEKHKITFLLDVSKLPARQVPRLNIQNTPDSVKVLGMLIF